MTARRGRYSAGEETRVLLIETAERLFARRGYDAVTLAEIRSAAGQNNASVISYYFGSKANLLRAILEYRLPAINANRDELFRRASEKGGDLTVRDALWCLVEPSADTLGGTNHYPALLDRLLDAGVLGDAFTAADPAATVTGFEVDRVLRAGLSELPEDVRGKRVQMVYESVLRTLGHYDRSGSSPSRAEVSTLVDAWQGLLQAPLSDETLAARRMDAERRDSP